MSSAVGVWERFSARAYLGEYYRTIGPETEATLRFLAASYALVPSGSEILEVGCGPTVYQLLSAAVRATAIDVADYLDQNLSEIARWTSAAEDAFDWTPFTRRVLEIEGIPATPRLVRDREDLLRGLIRNRWPCDLLGPPPVVHAPPEVGSNRYDAVGANFVLESITDDHATWRAAFAHTADLVRPGGLLIMSALDRATHWSAGAHAFPACPITSTDIGQAMNAAGFTVLICVETPADVVLDESADHGYEGFVFATGRRESRHAPTLHPRPTRMTAPHPARRSPTNDPRLERRLTPRSASLSPVASNRTAESG